MILETIAGGALRFAPELLKWLDRKDDRKHELSMFDKQIAADAQKAQGRLDEINASHSAAVDSKELDALIAGVTAQGQSTGIGPIDAINSLVRPVLTLYWCIGLYTFVLIARYLLLLQAGVDPLAAVEKLWGAREDAIVGAMLGFWFLDRAIRCGGGVGGKH